MARKKRFELMLTILVTKKMHQQLIKISEEQEKDMSEIVRTLIRKEFERRGVDND